MSGKLLAILVDGTTRELENDYISIKNALDGATIDFVRISASAGYFINDNGMLERLQLNVAASMMAGRNFYGPVVMTAALPDDEGDTLPPERADVTFAEALGGTWASVLAFAERTGQDLAVYADPDRLPMPEVRSMTEDEFLAFLEGGE